MKAGAACEHPACFSLHCSACNMLFASWSLPSRAARLPLRFPAPPFSCGYNLAPVDGGARPLPMTIRRGFVLEDASAQVRMVFL